MGVQCCIFAPPNQNWYTLVTRYNGVFVLYLQKFHTNRTFGQNVQLHPLNQINDYVTGVTYCNLLVNAPIKRCKVIFDFITELP